MTTNMEKVKNSGITARSFEVCGLVRYGMNNRAIAEAMNIKTDTVEHYLNDVYSLFDIPKWRSKRIYLYLVLNDQIKYEVTG